MTENIFSTRDVFFRSVKRVLRRTSGLQAAACVNSSTRSRKAGSCSMQVSIMAGGRRHGNTYRIHLPHGKLIIIRCASCPLEFEIFCPLQWWKEPALFERWTFASAKACAIWKSRDFHRRNVWRHRNVHASKNQGFTNFVFAIGIRKIVGRLLLFLSR